MRRLPFYLFLFVLGLVAIWLVDCIREFDLYG